MELCPGMWIPACVFAGVVGDHTWGEECVFNHVFECKKI